MQRDKIKVICDNGSYVVQNQDIKEFSNRTLYKRCLSLQYLGFCTLLKGSNIELAKNYFYMSGLLSIACSNLGNFNIHELYFEHILIAALSDHQEMIMKYSKLRNDDFNNETIIPLIQAALQNDDFLLKTFIDYRRKNWKQKIMSSMGVDLDFFEGLLNRDKQLMETSIYKLLGKKLHRKRCSSINYYEVISILATGYAKIAWLRGLEVNIDDPLVPKELLPIKPIKKYWEFRFMKTKGFKECYDF